MCRYLTNFTRPATNPSYFMTSLICTWSNLPYVPYGNKFILFKLIILMDSPHSAPSPQHPHVSPPSLPPSSYPDSPLQHRQLPHTLLHFSSPHPPEHPLPLPPALSPFQSLYPTVYRLVRASIRLCSRLRCRKTLEMGLF